MRRKKQGAMDPEIIALNHMLAALRQVTDNNRRAWVLATAAHMSGNESFARLIINASEQTAAKQETPVTQPAPVRAKRRKRRTKAEMEAARAQTAEAPAEKGADKKGRKMSAEARGRIAKAQLERWARQREAAAAATQVDPVEELPSPEAPEFATP